MRLLYSELGLEACLKANYKEQYTDKGVAPASPESAELRMIVFDRVPWPRPDILHKARREQFGKTRYDDMITRLRLKQAFGRLIRRAGDRGVFVTLDARLPTRLTTAFPPGVEVQRVGLSEAIAEVRAFLGPEMP